MPFAANLNAAVVLARMDTGNLHIGILFKGVGGTVSAIHLGWEDSLRLDWPYMRLWASPQLEPERLRSIGGICRLVWTEFETTRKFPYGVHFASQFFTPDGKLQLAPTSEIGLTCASFVLAIFRTAGIELVDIAQWPVRLLEDEAFFKMVSPFAKPMHLASLRAEIDAGCIRVHPQEVMAACNFDPPCSFENASAFGKEVDLMLAS